MDEERAARLLGSTERRAALHNFEVRDGSDENTFLVRGYASVAESPYDVYGGPDRGGFVETISRDAFNKTLADNPDVSLLINHEGMPLARTKSGTLRLSADNTGLLMEAEVDRRDPFSRALEIKLQRGDLDQMSFGFRVQRQEWNDDYTDRRITEVNLNHGDVSVVNIPANPATSVSAVSARSAIAAIREMDLAEVRGEGGLDLDELHEAHARIGELIEQMTGQRSITVIIGDDTDAGDSDDDAQVVTDAADDADDSDDDQDDDQVSALIALLTQLVGNSDLKLAPRAAAKDTEFASAETEIPAPAETLSEVRDEEGSEERDEDTPEVPEQRSVSARLRRYQLLVEEGDVA